MKIDKALYFLVAILFVSCDSFLDVKLSNSQVTNETVFTDDLNANAAVAGLYKTMVLSSFAGGGSDGVPALTGLSSDELHNFMQDLSFVSFEDNSLLSDNDKVLRLWAGGYQIIYEANSIIENLDRYYSGSDSIRQTLQGEALFVRAYCYFYLINLFGDVPLITTTDYRSNASMARSSVSTVYELILDDLIKAKTLLPESYVRNERVRPNRYSATALLSRVYLYLKDWKSAELNASDVIGSGSYSIVNDLNEVFKKSSNEVIWQLSSDFPTNTVEASNFVTLYGPGSSTVAITEKLLQSFEETDLRLVNWIGTYDDGSVNIKFPYKYKIVDYGAEVIEHYVVLRLAEQFLIRAEARAMMDDYSGAIGDINVIKARAGIDTLVDGAELQDRDVLLEVIMKERFLELFTEGGHRWFDLRRNNKAQEELQNSKPQWSRTDELYPIPQKERQQNPKLGDQNPGY